MKDYANMFFCYIIVLRIKLRRMYHLSYISFQKLYMIECKCVSITLPKFKLLFAELFTESFGLLSYNISLDLKVRPHF